MLCRPKRPWLDIAKREIGVKEIPGPKHSGRVLEYHMVTKNSATTDEVPWCSSFMNWIMLQAGFRGTGSAAARSWLDWGETLSEPRYGAVVVLWRGSKDSWTGHVGLYMCEDDEFVFLLGGNQGNRVCIQGYPKEQILGYRWPVKEAR